MDIAIVGAACRLPGAPSLAGLADLLFSRRDAVTEIPAERWAKRFYLDTDPHQAGKAYTFAAGCLEDVDQFDAAFFGMSPREAMHTDPQQRLLLELAYEAFEDAGLKLSQLSGSNTSVFVGCSAWDYATVKLGDISLMDSHSMQGLSLSSLSNRLSYVFNLRGPSLTVDTACSSALVALHMACESIRRGESSQAIVGAANLLLSPQNFVGFSRASMLSPTGRCHAFDARADGYVRAEGGGIVVLKPLADAIAAGDDIRAVIRATGVNSDGHTSSFSVPGREAQARLLNATYSQAEVHPDDLSYLEAHGTGTPVGDPIEAGALGEALAQKRSRPLPIGSVKSNVGHLEAASGMAGLMKVLAILERSEIPPSLHCETPNPNIPFSELNLSLTPRARPLEPGPNGVMIGINSFGFGGTNAHAILAAYTPETAPAAPSPVAPPLLISARSEAALQELARDWSQRLKRETRPGAAALLRAAARKREPFDHRLALPGGRPEVMAQDLCAWLAGSETAAVAGRAASGDGAVAFVYSGNGSQWVGMGADAFAHSSAFRDAVADVDASFVGLAGWSLAAALRDGVPEQDLEKTEIAQPLLFAVQVGVTTALRAAGVEPAAVVGHSAGEAAAAWASGALSLSQATEVIYHRSRLQQTTHGQGGMAVLNVPEDIAQPLLATAGPDLHVAAINAPQALTIAGPEKSLVALQGAARDARRAFLRLPLHYAFHSPAMDPIETPLMAALASLKPDAPSIKMVSTTTGMAIGAGEMDADYWWRNVRLPVQFSSAISQLVDDGVRIFVEIGPKPTLLSYVQAVLKQAGQTGVTIASLLTKPSMRDPFPTIAAQAFVAGANIQAAAVFNGSTAHRRLPSYPWQKQRHWGGSTVEAFEVASPIEDHPLLGFRRDDARRLWTNVLSISRLPWLADHCVNGLPVLPGAAMLDMAFAAGRTRTPDAPALEVTDMEFLRPLVVEGARELVFEMISADAFELSSRPRLAAEDRVVYARGRLATSATAEPLFRPLAQGPASTLSADEFYTRTAKVQLNYGPEFRPIDQVKQFSPEEAEASFRPPETRTELEPGWLVDPRLLDAALQAMFGTRSYDFAKPGDGVLPWRFGRVRLLKPGVAPVKAVVRLNRIGPKAHNADFALLDADGEVVAELLQCWFARVRPGKAEAPERAFLTTLIPAARQPAQPAITFDAGEAPEHVADPSEILAHAFATASAFEVVSALAIEGAIAPEELVAQGKLAPESSDLLAELLRWLAEDRLAQPQGSAWQLAAESGLPGAAEIWQSLMFDEPSAIADTALAAITAANLARALREGPHVLEGAPALREQLFEASPTARAGSAVLAAQARKVLSAWPKSRPLRIAIAGEPSAGLVRDILADVGALGVMARFTVIGGDHLLSTVETELKRHPGTTFAKTVAAVPAEARFDLVVGAFSLSLDVLTPERAAGLCASNGRLLLLEPDTSRVWRLANSLAAPAAAQQNRLEQLRRAGLEVQPALPVSGRVWPASVITATAPEQAEAEAADLSSLAIFGVSELSERVAQIAGVAVRPLYDLATATDGLSGQDVLLTAPDGADLAALATFAGSIAPLTPHLGGANAPRLWLAYQGDPASPVAQALRGLRRVMTNEGLDARFICLEDGVAAKRLVADIAANDEEQEVVLTADARLAPRLRLGLPAKPKPKGPVRLEIQRPGLLGSLAWEPIELPPLGDGQVAIEVKASGLNFRDVMWALGVLPDEALMDGFSGPTLGLECAGVITAVGAGVQTYKPGDRVAALAPAALASHVVTEAATCMPIPQDVDFCAAATIPVTTMTVIYALGHLAQLRPGERVLIHGGLGGVGLAAIQYASYRGAEIFATAGSADRRALLRTMGVKHVFDSRTAAFADEIRKVTDGKGVDVVLNSLSGELMQQSLKLLKPFGRFLEIGKRDLFANSEIGLRALRHNVTYYAIDADQLPVLAPELAGTILEWTAKFLAAGDMRGLPYREYAASDIVDAFRLMQGSGHIGKVIVTPDEVRPAPLARPKTSFALRKDRTYLVTGGAGGFGLETARWLADRGARHLALLSRQGPATPGIEAALDAFKAQGVEAHVYASDVGNAADLAAALAEIRLAQPPIAGVIHAAMVMDDGLLADLNPERFATSLRPKLLGAEALDRLTREDPIELFVLYSSISAAIGNPGQGNYVAANAAMEATALSRARAGLPALAVQWGPISDSGFLARDTRTREIVERMMASGELTSRAALDALPDLLESGLPVAGFAVADWGQLKRQMPIGATALMTEAADDDLSRVSESSIRDQIITLPLAEAHALAETFLVDEVAEILRLDHAEVDVERPISQMGFDSLMMLELHLAVEQRLRCDLPLMSVGGGATLRSIATRVVKGLRAEGGHQDEATDLEDHFLRHEEAAPEVVAGPAE